MAILWGCIVYLLIRFWGTQFQHKLIKYDSYLGKECIRDKYLEISAATVLIVWQVLVAY